MYANKETKIRGRSRKLPVVSHKSQGARSQARAARPEEPKTYTKHTAMGTMLQHVKEYIKIDMKLSRKFLRLKDLIHQYDECAQC